MSKERINGQDRAKARQPDHTELAGKRTDQEWPRYPGTGEERQKQPRDPHTGEAGRNPQDIEPGTRRRDNDPPA